MHLLITDACCASPEDGTLQAHAIHLQQEVVRIVVIDISQGEIRSDCLQVSAFPLLQLHVVTAIPYRTYYPT